MDRDMTTRLERQFLTTPGGVRLHVVVRPGDEPAMLCLHGAWDDWQYWRSLAETDNAETLSQRRIIMPDLRGHGESDKPDRGYGIQEYVCDVMALAESLDGVSTIVGHSLGAIIALHVAAALPSQIRRLVLEDPPLPARREFRAAFRTLHDLREQEMVQVIDDLQYWRANISADEARESARRLKQTAPGVFQAYFEEGWEAQFVLPTTPLAGVQALIITPDNEDQRALTDEGEAMLRSLLPEMRVSCIPDAGHTVLRDAPVAYLRSLTDALD